MIIRSVGGALIIGLMVACTTREEAPERTPAEPASGSSNYGVLLMAHGGDAAWNRAVEAAAAPLAGEFPTEIAFGMADAVSLQEGVKRLEARGVRRIGVVRLFVSGESWYGRTEQILGLAPDAPERPVEDCPEHPADDQGHAGHSMEFWRIKTDSAFALSTQGLADARGMAAILVERARALSHQPESEDVLLVAHGPGDDGENEHWIAKIGRLAGEVREARPFRRVQVLTLREDWPDKRAPAEERIRAFVARAGEQEGRAIVIPFRVHGFGPYADVLAGLEYTADGRGLLPHPNVTRWITEQARALRSGRFRTPLGRQMASAGR